MKKLILTFAFVMLTTICTQATDNANPVDYTTMYNQTTTVFNAINLTEEQICKKNEIENERAKELKPYLEKLEQEQNCYTKLKEQNASKANLIHQQRKVRFVNKDVNKINEKYDRKIKKILNTEQRNKLHNIKRLQNREYKEQESNNKRKYLEDKKLRTFGEK